MNPNYKSKLHQLSLLIFVIRKRIVRFFNKFCDSKKRIQLAVLGTPASGKSFLLVDIIQSIENMGYPNYELDRKRYDYNFKDINDYKPDEVCGYGGTPYYACRQENLYIGVMGKKKGFILDFLNIPGETFIKPAKDSKANKEPISPVDAYNNLRGVLQREGKYFTVTTYVRKGMGDIKLIVEPRKTRPISLGNITASQNRFATKDRKTEFLSWEDILSVELENYEPVIGLTRNIDGTTLLKHFFEYQTDSIIRSIADLIKTGEISDVGFDNIDFEKKAYDKAFVFLHYCTRATDMVLCDRITPDKKEKISFDELSAGISKFLDKYNKTTRVYLAFRCVDYLLYEKEKNYINLNKNILKDIKDIKAKQNVIYSVFHSSMLYHVFKEQELKEVRENYDYFIGLDQFDGLKKEELLQETHSDDDFLSNIAHEYVDFDGYVNEEIQIQHITSRFGGLGNADAFRRLLQKTGIDALDDIIVPHVYFTSTPITSEYEMYKNYQEEVDGKEMMALDFKRVSENGIESTFWSRSSQACLGTFQLCMDILNHHQLRNFTQGSLLRHLQGVK